MNKLLLACLVGLAGCATQEPIKQPLQPIPVTPVVRQSVIFEPPARLMESCPDIDNPDAKNLGGLIKYTINLMGQYTECATKHDQLIDYNKQHKEKLNEGKRSK